MKKYTVQETCPCGSYEYKLIYNTDEGKCQTFYCPFCGSIIESEEDFETDLDDD